MSEMHVYRRGDTYAIAHSQEEAERVADDDTEDEVQRRMDDRVSVL